MYRIGNVLYTSKPWRRRDSVVLTGGAGPMGMGAGPSSYTGVWSRK